MVNVQRLTNGTTGGPVFVDVKDGEILRITPIDLDETDAPSWKIEARGRTFSPSRRTTMSPWTVAHRSTIYSPKRILTPLKRVDFDPKGERNCQNRGVSGYEPIGWDEALDLVADEMMRVKRELGPGGILSTPGSHHMWGNVGYRFSAYYRFMDLVGMTYAEHNPDSWEGWHWGAMHMWGFSHRLGIPEQYDLLEDALQNTEMVVFWSADPESTSGCYAAFESTARRFWLKELGVKMVFIDPYFNHTAGLFSDKWFAPRLGTDVAFGLAIAYTWLTEGTYDKDYVAGRTTGFDEWKDYVLGGGEDGLAKTPEWAEGECGIPARDIRALAREWAAKKTMLASGGFGGMGGACRAATGNEWARTMVALAAMQGLGKPGSNIWSTTSGAPVDASFMFPGYSEGGISCNLENTAAGFRWAYRMFPRGGATSNVHHSVEGQTVPRLRIPEAMLHQSLEWRGKGFCGGSIQSQLKKYEYPAPGYPHVGMYYRYGGSFFGTMTETNRYVKAYQTDKVPFIVNQSIWMEGEAKFADVILPACTNFERVDISEFAWAAGYGCDGNTQPNHRIIVLQKKCIVEVRLRDIRRALQAAGRVRHVHYGGQDRIGLGEAGLPCHRPSRARDLGGVREEGLLRRPCSRGPHPDASAALVCRRPCERHARLGSSSFGHHSICRVADHLGQDRVRGFQSHIAGAVGNGGLRATGDGPPIHRVLGRPSHDGSLRHVPSATGLPPSAVQLPHHGRRQGFVDQ
jgi:anaerobic selenocysteine-containing dehydrogenase